MAKFRCERFPHGVVRIRTESGIVDFTDGEAEVADADLAAGLREVPEDFGIVEVPPSSAPRKRAVKSAD